MAKILVVDDERVARSVVTFLLREEGHEVLEASDWDSTQEVLRNHRPRVVILDVGLPGISGDRIATLIPRTFSYGIEIVLWSGMEPDELAAMAKGLGLEFHLYKGASASQTRMTVEHALQKAYEKSPASRASSVPAQSGAREDGRGRVLLVDANEPVPRMAKVALECEGLDVELIHDVPGLLVALDQGPCDVVVFDPNGLSEDAEKVLEVVRTCGSGPRRFVLWTGEETEVPAGADHRVAKAGSLKDVVNAIGEVLGHVAGVRLGSSN